MKFYLTKEFCAQKNPTDIHKELCNKNIIEKSVYEQLGPYDKFRDENLEIYKQKYEKFQKKAKIIQDANIKALANNRPKNGEQYRIILNETDNLEITGEDLKYVESSIILNAKIDRKNGEKIRKRYERNYKEVWETNNEHCYTEPWFRRYIILCRFITAARKIILIHRLEQKLVIFKFLRKNKHLLIEYENQYIKYEHNLYHGLFEKFLNQESST